MKINQIQELDKFQKIEGVDVFEIKQKNGKTVIRMYPSTVKEETKTLVLDNGEEEPIQISDEPETQINSKTFKYKDNDMSDVERRYRTDAEIVWDAAKEKIRRLFE